MRNTFNIYYIYMYVYTNNIVKKYFKNLNCSEKQADVFVAVVKTMFLISTVQLFFFKF